MDEVVKGTSQLIQEQIGASALQVEVSKSVLCRSACKDGRHYRTFPGLSNIIIFARGRRPKSQERCRCASFCDTQDGDI
jgi:hypothetical protein